MRATLPSIRTTTVGSYPTPAWLSAHPTEQGIVDATRVVVDIQRQCGIDLPTDGELSRFDVDHPDTNGMIEYFVRPLGGVRSEMGWGDWKAFARRKEMEFRSKPAGVVDGPIGEGSLNLVADYLRTRSVAGPGIKFTVTSPFMLARTLLDNYYHDTEALVSAIGRVLASQAAEIDAACIQVDEANVPGDRDAAPVAAKGINMILDAAPGETAVHLCFGNYGGQTIQAGGLRPLIEFLNSLHCDHLVLEAAHRPTSDIEVLKEVDRRIMLGIGVIDIKVNHVETPDEVARRIEQAASILGADRIGWVHPDCGFWMLTRSVADRKIESLARGRDLFLGRSREAECYRAER